MTRKKQDPNRVDALLDELLEEHQSPEEILGEVRTAKAIKQALDRTSPGGRAKGTPERTSRSRTEQQPKRTLKENGAI